MRLLLVCTGNTCRSPMAEGLLRHTAARRGLPVEVASAGIYALPGAPASEHTLKVLRDRGIDLSGHQAQVVTEELLRESDLVLTMTRGHKQALLDRFPWAAGKVYTLGEYAGGPDGAEVDVPDPIGGPLEMYEETAATLEGLLERVVERLAAQRADGHGDGNGSDGAQPEGEGS